MGRGGVVGELERQTHGYMNGNRKQRLNIFVTSKKYKT